MDEALDREDDAQPSLFGPGTELRQAREKAGLTIQQVAAQTRISARHIEMIEAERFGEMPGRTYAIGFSRSYAKLLELDEGRIAGQVREALDAIEPDQHRYHSATFEPGDPARIPSARLGWFAALAALLLLAGGFSFYRSYFSPEGRLPAIEDPAALPAPGTAPRASPPSALVAKDGEVVFTAEEEGIWVKFYDGSGKQLMQKQMAMGERYVVPPDAQGPQLWTGRPDALAITIAGKPVPRLSETDQVMRDVPVTAKALLARPGSPAPAARPSPTG